MRKIAVVLFVLMITAAMTASAVGDKVRGEKGEGQTHQVQERNTDKGTPLFQDIVGHRRSRPWGGRRLPVGSCSGIGTLLFNVFC